MNDSNNIPLAKDRRCPVCGDANECRVANGCLYKDACWCESSKIPAWMQRYLASLQPEPACLCRRCLETVQRVSALCDQPEEILARVRSEVTPVLTAEDFYRDPEGHTVFTAAYHLKRGYCCESGCRHCPFRGSASLPSAIQS